MKKVIRAILSSREAALLLLLVALMVFAKVSDPRFVTFETQAKLSTHVWELAIVALPMLYIIITGGIDLSVGSIVALSGVMIGLLFEKGMNPMLAAAIGIVCATFFGWLNGWFVAKLKVHPLIVTLATMAAFRGIAEGISFGRPISGFPQSFRALAEGAVAGVPVPGILFAMLTIAGGFILTRTTFGRWVFAIGHKERAALFSGIPVARVKMTIYALAGTMCGLAAAILVARNNTAKADIAAGLELDAITAVVLGGASMDGGRGNIWGFLLGVALIHETREFVSWHWDKSELNFIVIGALLIISVLMHTLMGARKSRSSKSGS